MRVQNVAYRHVFEFERFFVLKVDFPWLNKCNGNGVIPENVLTLVTPPTDSCLILLFNSSTNQKYFANIFILIDFIISIDPELYWDSLKYAVIMFAKPSFSLSKYLSFGT